jgi:hypothetical protein
VPEDVGPMSEHLGVCENCRQLTLCTMVEIAAGQRGPFGDERGGPLPSIDVAANKKLTSIMDHRPKRPRQPLHDYRGLSSAAVPAPPRA